MNYKKARDLAWKILLEDKISSLPIDVIKICKNRKITLITYQQGKELIKALNLEDQIVDNDAFSFENIICYDDTKPSTRQRFSIAHELGHIFMHINQSKYPTRYNRAPAPSDDPVETEANIFASRLLAPLCVLQFMNLNSVKDISDYCDISYYAAKIRFERLCEIRKRNSNRRKEKNHGTFLLSKLEREVIENFKEYIEKNKKG